jgi:GNAT superfamily N-acetyltransferase
MSVETETIDALRAIALTEQLITVYRAVFTLPPYDEQEEQVAAFAAGFPQHAAREGFRCVIARREDTLLGFAFGSLSRPGGPWHESLRGMLDDAAAAYWLADAFEFNELALAPAARGHGAGGRLHDALLHNLPTRTALLSTPQQETPAMQLYRNRGWRVIQEYPWSDDTGLRYVVMGLEMFVRSLGQAEGC